MPSTYFNTEGLIIKKMPFGESDFLIRALSKDFGKIDVLAKGARKSGSKLNAHLDILNHARISYVKNGERISTLTDAEIISKYDDWFLDADRLSVAGRVIQVLDMLILHGSPDKKLFQLIIDFFSTKGGSAYGGENTGAEGEAIDFLRQVFEHEGYGSFLPPEHEQAIIKLWPGLMI